MRNPNGQFAKDVARKLLEWLKWASPLTWLQRLGVTDGGDGLTEAYAIAVTLVQVSVYWCTWEHAAPLALVLSAWLLIEMLVALLNIQLFHRERVDEAKSKGEPHTPLDPARSVILFVLNFVQAVFAFALFYNYLYQASHNYFDFRVRSPTRLDWLNFSTMTLTMVGDSTITAVRDPSKSVVSLEVLVGLFFTAIVVANFASLLMPRDGDGSRGAVNGSAGAADDGGVRR